MRGLYNESEENQMDSRFRGNDEGWAAAEQ